MIDLLAGSLQGADWIVLAIYFAVLTVIGVGTSCIGRKKDTVNSYFLAGQSMTFLPIGTSLFVSNIGSGHFIGLAGAGAASGIGVASFDLISIFLLLLLGWAFVPKYLKEQIYTTPEYVSKKFGRERIRIYLSIISILLYIFTKISVDLYSGAIFMIEALHPIPVNLYMCIGFLLILAAIFTIIGGLHTVIWTDLFQTVIMLIGSVTLAAKAYSKLSSFNEIEQKFPNAVSHAVLNGTSNCSIPNENYMSIWRSVDSDYPWTGMIFGSTVNSVWYWCTDQVIVQRVLAAKHIEHGRSAVLVAGFLKFFPLFLVIIPGMISRILYPNEIGCASPDECLAACGNAIGCTNMAYPRLVMRLMPNGVRGLMLSVMIASLLSSLTSIFNSASTLFTVDIWLNIRKSASQKEQLIVGKLSIIFIVLLSVLWIPLINKGETAQLFDYLQAILSILTPPVSSLFICVLFIPFMTEMGVLIGLIFGFFLGVIRFILTLVHPKLSCFQQQHLMLKDNYATNTIYFIRNLHYLHFAAFLFLLTFIIMIVVSLMEDRCKKSRSYHMNGNTNFVYSIPYDDRGANLQLKENEVPIIVDLEKEHDRLPPDHRRWIIVNRIIAVSLITLVLFVWIYFSQKSI
ncbi:hypothetical protein SNEBB_006085 [Seison nebaliae]|nr:hypothetical protein SNEBB_006085 [Seison nebaliae]